MLIELGIVSLITSVIVYKSTKPKLKTVRLGVCFVKSEGVYIPWVTREFTGYDDNEITDKYEKEESVLSEIAFNPALSAYYKAEGVEYFSTVNLETGDELYLVKLI